MDSFPLSTVGKRSSNPPSVTDLCRKWIGNCLGSGFQIRVPAIVYYETLRELERLDASDQIKRVKVFCFSDSDRFIPLETSHLELAAKLWSQSRKIGKPTSDPHALDGDVILAAQALSMELSPLDYVVATTNPSHLSQFVPCELWENIKP